ncbi:MAG: deaminase [Candidatus Micrarchaeia archaeon]|jgi:tRNA(adenine34) deaminase
MKAAARSNGNGLIAGTIIAPAKAAQNGKLALPTFFREPALDLWKQGDAKVMADIEALNKFCEAAMHEAIAEAQKGIKARRRPFGAVIVAPSGEVIGRGHNTMNRKATSGKYAEENAFESALSALGKRGRKAKDLEGCALACTCEPTLQDMWRAHQLKISLVVFGATADDALRAGFIKPEAPPYIASEIFENIARKGWVLRDECATMMHGWKEKRKGRK